MARQYFTMSHAFVCGILINALCFSRSSFIFCMCSSARVRDSALAPDSRSRMRSYTSFMFILYVFLLVPPFPLTATITWLRVSLRVFAHLGPVSPNAVVTSFWSTHKLHLLFCVIVVTVNEILDRSLGDCCEYDEQKNYDNRWKYNSHVIKVLNVLNFILLFTYFLQPFETGCGVVSDITSAHYWLSYWHRNRQLLSAWYLSVMRLESCSFNALYLIVDVEDGLS